MFNFTDKLDNITCPVLTIGAYDDNVIGSDATMEIAKKMNCRRDFRLYMYRGYGHASYDTAPDYKARIYSLLIGEKE